MKIGKNKILNRSVWKNLASSFGIYGMKNHDKYISWSFNMSSVTTLLNRDPVFPSVYSTWVKTKILKIVF